MTYHFETDVSMGIGRGAGTSLWGSGSPDLSDRHIFPSGDWTLYRL